MSVQVLCASCGFVAEFHQPPVTACARCHAALPEALRLATERALAREQAPRPLLLTLGQWGSLFAGPMFLLFLFLAPFDVGTYTVGDEVVSGPEFLRRGGWMFAVIGGLLLAIGVGLWRERAWVRPLMVVYWLSLALLAFTDADGGAGDAVAAIAFAVLWAGIAAWYVYRKPNVRAYFAARAARESDRSGV